MSDADWELYATEAYELIELAEASVLALEKHSEPDDLNALYRAMHTVKGNSRVVGLEQAERLAHRTEDVVALVRDHGLQPDEAWSSLLLTSLDILRRIVEDSVEQQRDVDAPYLGPALAALDAYLELHGDLVPEHEEAMDAPGDIFLFDDDGEPQHILDPNFWPEDLVEPAPEQGPPPASEGLASSAPGPDAQATHEVASPVVGQEGPPPKTPTAKTFRISSTKIDQVMSLAGELHLALGKVFDHPALADIDSDDFQVGTHRVEKIVQELQDAAAGLGLTPVRGVFSRAKRVVRDLGLETGKPLELVVNDRGTEVDRVLVDRLYDPIVHLIRNAADHGVESVDQRRAAGKPEHGTITLSARQDGGQIVILVEDDGRGLNRDRILARARERGLVSPRAQLSEHEIDQLIFAPGFSTAERVSTLSGRGVGMDVVLTTIRELGGRAEVSSKSGQGTRVELRVPLTMAFAEVLVVRVGDGFFGIPMNAVIAMVRPEPTENVVVATSEGNVSVRLHGELMPLRSLERLLGLPGDEGTASGHLLVAIRTAHGSVALPIENLVGTESVTIKSLPAMMQSIPAAAACGVLRSGHVIVIMDCNRVAAAKYEVALAS